MAREYVKISVKLSSEVNDLGLDDKTRQIKPNYIDYLLSLIWR